MNIKNVDINSIIPYEHNPRINDDSVQYVANSIKQFGFKQPIVVDKDYVIIAGHTRWKAAKKLGMTEVPVVIADDLDEDKVRAYRIADNKVGEDSAWDWDELLDEIYAIKDNIGFSLGDLNFDIYEQEEDEFEFDDDSTMNTNTSEDIYSNVNELTMVDKFERPKPDVCAFSLTFPIDAKKKIQNFIRDFGISELANAVLEYIDNKVGE